MKLYRNNSIIINATELKGTIEENSSHKGTRGLVRDHRKNHYGENPFKFFFLLYYHKMLNKEREREYNDPYIQPHNYSTKYSKQHPRDGHNNDNNQNPDSKSCDQLSMSAVNYQILWLTGKLNPTFNNTQRVYIHVAKTLQPHS